MSRLHFRTFAALLVPIALLAACGNDDDSPADTTVAPVETAAPDTTPVETVPAAPDTVPTDTAAPTADTIADTATPAVISPECATDKLTLVNAGKLTIGTDKPAFGPWFSDDDPTNGKGFESAVAYAVAETLGFAATEVSWTTVAFNTSYAPGKKNFDFDVNQISITDDRKQAVDFSDGYYDVNQAVVALNGTPAASAASIADLKAYKFGAQVGTTSLEFINTVIQPTAEPFVYDDTNAAKAALLGKQIDAIVSDLPTAFYISAAEIENSKVVGQFESAGGGEQFGLLFEKGSALVPCVNEALAVLKSTGKLAAIQEAELAQATQAPVLR